MVVSSPSSRTAPPTLPLPPSWLQQAFQQLPQQFPSSFRGVTGPLGDVFLPQTHNLPVKEAMDNTRQTIGFYNSPQASLVPEGLSSGKQWQVLAIQQAVLEAQQNTLSALVAAHNAQHPERAIQQPSTLNVVF